MFGVVKKLFDANNTCRRKNPPTCNHRRNSISILLYNGEPCVRELELIYKNRSSDLKVVGEGFYRGDLKKNYFVNILQTKIIQNFEYIIKLSMQFYVIIISFAPAYVQKCGLVVRQISKNFSSPKTNQMENFKTMPSIRKDLDNRYSKLLK